MKVLNGVEVYDPLEVGPDYQTEVLSTVHSIPDLALLMDGSTSNMDEVHKIAATTTGGVGGAWTEESNWQNLLCAKAPVIAEATDNLFSNEHASYEGGTAGSWVSGTGTLSNSTEDAFHGSRSLKIAATAAPWSLAIADITGITAAGTQYTASIYVKANNAGAVGSSAYLRLTGNVSGNTNGTAITLTTNWQLMTVTKTFNVGDGTRQIYIVNSAGGAAGDEVLFDALQLEQRGYATPYATDSRTASTMTFPTASLGLVAGQDMTIVVATKTPWPGNDGANHYFVDTRDAADPGLALYKSSGNVLAIRTWKDDATNKYQYGAVSGTNWAADIAHVVVATLDTSNNQHLFLDGAELGSTAGTAGREDGQGVTVSMGVDYNNTNPANAPLLVAIYNRVLSANEIALLSKMGAWCQRMRGF